MKDLASLYLAHGFSAVAQEDVSQYPRQECTDLLEWAAEYKKWDLFHHVLPYADKSRTCGFALRKCIENQYVPGVELLLPYNDLRDPSLLARFDACGQAVDCKNPKLLQAVLTPVCKACCAYDCDHAKEVVGGCVDRADYTVLYNTAISNQRDMFKILLAVCDQSRVRCEWDVEWRLKTPIAALFDQTVEELAHEQNQRISAHISAVSKTHQRKM